MKKILCVFFTVLITLLSLTVLAQAEDVKYFDNNALATIITASDFQSPATGRAYFNAMITQAQNDGLPSNVDVLLGGDYNNTVGVDPTSQVTTIKNQLQNKSKKYIPTAIPLENIRAIQGNHDLASDVLISSGLHDCGNYYLYVLNEDDFYSGQGTNSSAKKDIQNLAKNMDNSFKQIIESNNIKPVIVASHIPLHHNSRLSYGENMYSKYIFDVLNERGKWLNIVFLFGHTHTGSFDDYIGGGINYLPKGSNIRIPNYDKTASSTSYTNNTLNFTYANYGYVGSLLCKYNQIRSMNVIQLYDTDIKVVRYTVETRAADTDPYVVHKSVVQTRPAAYIDYTKNIIGGISAKTNNLDNLCISNPAFRVSYDSIGTGKTVKILYNNTPVETYQILIYGDVNGDGLYTKQDADIVSNYLKNNAGLTQGSLQYLAADANRDGKITQKDVDLINQADKILNSTNQSDYKNIQKYANSICQTITGKEIDNPSVTELTTPKDNSIKFLDSIGNFFRNIITKISDWFKNIFYI